MSIDFNAKDITHSIQVKFINAYLPDAKKAFNLKVVHQPELDIHGIASKAEIYNIATSAKVIEEGLTAATELILYLLADGYRIKTPLYSLKLRIPGEYNGSETHLPPDIFPVARLQTTAHVRKYLKERIKTEFDGTDQSEGMIAQATDEATGLIDEAATIGNILTIHGYGLKIDSDEEHTEQAGMFFAPASGVPIKAQVIAVNENRTLKVLVPAELVEGKTYQLAVETWSSAKGHHGILKTARDMRSEFVVTAQK
jgi:hypothetical protein